MERNTKIVKEMIFMGAYAMPSNKGFKTSKKLKRTHKWSNLDRCAALLRENDMFIDKKNNRIVLVKKDKGENCER